MTKTRVLLFWGKCSQSKTAPFLRLGHAPSRHTRASATARPKGPVTSPAGRAKAVQQVPGAHRALTPLCPSTTPNPPDAFCPYRRRGVPLPRPSLAKPYCADIESRWSHPTHGAADHRAASHMPRPCSRLLTQGLRGWWEEMKLPGPGVTEKGWPGAQAAQSRPPAKTLGPARLASLLCRRPAGPGGSHTLCPDGRWPTLAPASGARKCGRVTATMAGAASAHSPCAPPWLPRDAG